MDIFANIVFTIMILLASYIMVTSTNDEYLKGISGKLEYVSTLIISTLAFGICIFIIWAS